MRASPCALLTRHFLRRFLENDLLSPDADRSLLLAMVGAGVVSTTLFISTFMSSKYVMAFMTPGQVALAALDDRFFYLSFSMAITALVAASQWEALVVDARDAAILEPLPLPAATIRRAKLGAVAILGGVVALAVNVAPSVVFPWLVGFSLDMSVAWLPVLAAAHAAFTIAGALFAYGVLIALRELLALALGPRWFGRVSPWVQGGLVVGLGSALLLLPAAATRIEQGGFDGWRRLSPPMWFLGAYETAVGSVIAERPRGALAPRQAAADALATASYRALEPQMRAFAGNAVEAAGIVAAILLASHLWNARRLPSFVPLAAARARRRWRVARALAGSLAATTPRMRAGFFFALAVMARSGTHRLTLACVAAAGVAVAIVALSGIDLEAAAARGRPPARLLIVQPLLYGVLLVGFRHIIRVPAELRANWAFQLAWQNDDRAFVAGAKRAALLGLVVPALAVCVPVVAYVLGPWTAIAHAVMGFAGSLVLLEVLMLSYEKVPFACTYLPNDDAKWLVPAGVVAFLVGAAWLANLQAAALQGGRGGLRLLALLAIVFAAARLLSRGRPPLPYGAFDEAPASVQRLGLDS